MRLGGNLRFFDSWRQIIEMQLEGNTSRSYAQYVGLRII